MTGYVEPRSGGQTTEGCAIGESLVVLMLSRSGLRDGARTPMEQAPSSLVGQWLPLLSSLHQVTHFWTARVCVAGWGLGKYPTHKMEGSLAGLSQLITHHSTISRLSEVLIVP